MQIPPRLIQEEMIEKVRLLAGQDGRMVAVVMYGSFTQGEGDEFSDIEFFLFVRDEALKTFDREAWAAQIAPLEAFFVNEFGTQVAIFKNLVRGEFHFEPASKMDLIRQWASNVTILDPDLMLLLDRTGEARQHIEYLQSFTPERTDLEQVQSLINRYFNWMLFGLNVLRRGERARALDILGWVHRYLLWMARLEEGKFEHWPTPSRMVEQELSPKAYQRFITCTGSVRAPDLENAYHAAWEWGKKTVATLSSHYPIQTYETLIESIDRRIKEWLV